MYVKVGVQTAFIIITLQPIRMQTRVKAEMTVHYHSGCPRAIPGLMVAARVTDIQFRAPFRGLFAQESLHHRVSRLTDKELHIFLRFVLSSSPILNPKAELRYAKKKKSRFEYR